MKSGFSKKAQARGDVVKCSRAGQIELGQAAVNPGLVGGDFWVGFSNTVRGGCARFVQAVLAFDRPRIKDFMPSWEILSEKTVGGLCSEQSLENERKGWVGFVFVWK